MNKFSILIVLVFALVSCDKEPEPVVNDLIDTYQGQLVDIKTGEGIAGEMLSMWHYLGGTAVLNIDSTVSDASGNFEFKYDYNLDTVLAMAEMYEVDTQNIHNNIKVISEEYIMIKRYQNDVLLTNPPLRIEFAPNLPIVYELHRAEPINLTLTDTTNSDLFDRVSIMFTTLDSDLYTINIGESYQESPDWTTLLPVDEPIQISWIVSEGVLEYELEPVREFSDTIQLTDGTILEYEILY